jgi:glycosyltransferase involved in cell wall biosynthesis
MKVLFQTDTLNYRGSTVAVSDYARYNQEILGNESIICYDGSRDYYIDGGTEPEVLVNLQKEFQIVAYDQVSDLQELVDTEHVELAYFSRCERGWVPDNCRAVAHSVFQVYEPHADVYAYISEWLASEMNQRHNDSLPFVPHIVTLPEATDNLKDELGIKSGQTVIGRIGGLRTFDLPFVKQAIVDVLDQRDDYVFVFAGTQPWIDHPRVRYITEFHDVQRKANFFNTCDATIHARSNGESFGLAVAEALFMGKPVLTWEGGGDQNHTFMLQGSETIYNQNNIRDKLLNVRDYIGAEDWRQRVAQFAPEQVMKKFKEVFF